MTPPTGGRSHEGPRRLSVQGSAVPDESVMEPTVRLLRVRGIPVGVHWSWLLIFTIVVWSLVQALFPASYPGLSGTAYLAMSTGATVLLFA